MRGARWIFSFQRNGALWAERAFWVYCTVGGGGRPRRWRGRRVGGRAAAGGDLAGRGGGDRAVNRGGSGYAEGGRRGARGVVGGGVGPGGRDRVGCGGGGGDQGWRLAVGGWWQGWWRHGLGNLRGRGVGGRRWAGDPSMRSHRRRARAAAPRRRPSSAHWHQGSPPSARGRRVPRGAPHRRPAPRRDGPRSTVGHSPAHALHARPRQHTPTRPSPASAAPPIRPPARR